MRIAGQGARVVLGLTLCAALAGCGTGVAGLFQPREAPLSAEAPPADGAEAGPPLSALASDAAEGAEATAGGDPAATPPSGGPERELGRTIATLGDATDPGLWAKTPLVTAAQPGRLVYPANGNSVQVELRPLAGDPGAGTQVSLAAFRGLGAPLTGLPELIVLGR